MRFSPVRLLATLVAGTLCGGTVLAQTGVAANSVVVPATGAAAGKTADPRAAIVKKLDGVKLEGKTLMKK
jgi:hypothetical protein